MASSDLLRYMERISRAMATPARAEGGVPQAAGASRNSGGGRSGFATRLPALQHEQVGEVEARQRDHDGEGDPQLRREHRPGRYGDRPGEQERQDRSLKIQDPPAERRRMDFPRRDVTQPVRGSLAISKDRSEEQELAGLAVDPRNAQAYRQEWKKVLRRVEQLVLFPALAR